MSGEKDRRPASLEQIQSTILVLTRDFLDVQEAARNAAAKAEASATSSANTGRAVAALTEAVEALAASMQRWREEVDEALTALAEQEESKKQPSWLTIHSQEGVTAADAAKLLLELAGWVGTVWVRYPGGHLSHCWAYHPEVVSELLGVWQAWRAAYVVRKGCPTKVMEWLDRWRPNAAGRIAMTLGTCNLGNHTTGSGGVRLQARVPGGSDQLVALADWWISDPNGVPPAPEADAVQAETRESLL